MPRYKTIVQEMECTAAVHLGESLEANLSVLFPRARLEAIRFHGLSLRRRHLLRVA